MKTRPAAPLTRLRERAEQLAVLLPKTRLHPRVLEWAENSSRRARWCVAFSGGADSLSLLLLIWAHWPERRGRLRVLHFNHRLRGAASRGDALFCRKVCAELGVDFFGGEWREAKKGASEAEARAARLEFFSQHSRSLWQGHQQDDVAETMLMRIARGSGTAGLAAPRPVQSMPGGRTHLRPLLTLKKKEVLTALRKLGVSWREDASNAADDFFRNRVRRSVVPRWQLAAGRDVLAGAALARELLEEDDSALEEWLAELQPFNARGALDLAKLKGRPKALVRRALRLWLGRQRGVGELARQGFESLLEAVRLARPTRQSLGANVFAVIKGNELALARREAGTFRKAFRRFPRRAN